MSLKLLFFFILISFIVFVYKVTKIMTVKELLKDFLFIMIMIVMFSYLYLIYLEAFRDGIFI